jgi:SEC-C motif-containing protein
VVADASDQHCECGSASPFERCCGPLLANTAPATTAQALMRSRYTAFVLGDVDYLLRTWHPDTRPETLTINPAQRWLGLKVKTTTAGAVQDHAGEVEFVARYKIAGRGHRLHELSRFQRLAGNWVYVDGSRLGKKSEH